MQVNEYKNMRSDCPVSYSLDFFGDKWTFLIIRDMIFEGKRFYKDFLGSKEKIATNILSDRLKKLENIGVITSKTYEKLKTKKEYSLTQKGKDLLPVLLEVMVWSAKYGEDLAIGSEFSGQMKHNRDQIVSDILSKLE